MSGVGVGVDFTFDELFYVLEISSHPLLEILLGVASIDFICPVACNLVHYNRVMTAIAIRALPSNGSAVARASYKIKRFYVFNHLGREVALEDVAHVSETVV